MNYRIYQVYYKEEQKNFLNPEFTAFNNTSNKRPDLMEYYIFNVGYKKAISERLSHWGFFSWRWKEKCKINPHQFINFVDQNPNQDVYLINWAPYIESVNWNVWSHGEFYHPGIIEIANKCFQKMNYLVPPVESLLMDSNTFCYSSYFLGSKKFWSEYLIFLKQIKHCVDNDSELSSLFNEKIVYSGHKKWSFFPFLVERFFSTFLLLNKKKYSIINYPYDFSIYKKYIGENYNELKKCSELKTRLVSSYQIKDRDIFQKYLNDWQLQIQKVNFPITIPDCDLK
jgi:hypothetical protein